MLEPSLEQRRTESGRVLPNRALVGSFDVSTWLVDVGHGRRLVRSEETQAVCSLAQGMWCFCGVGGSWCLVGGLPGDTSNGVTFF